MAEMLLLNPRKRRARRAKRRGNPSPAQLRARAKFAAMARARSGKRRQRNPIGLARVRRAARRVYRRRRNPIALPSMGGITQALKNAAVMGGGAIAVDYLYAQLERVMPANLRRTPGRVDIGDAVKAIATVALGYMLNRPTRGFAMKAATGSLVVQMHGLIRSVVPAQFRVDGVDGLGYAVAAPVYDGVARVSPVQALDAYTAPGETPLLNEYVGPFDSPLLSGDELEGAEAEGYYR